MEISVQVPRAFSVRDENEFFAFRHLLARMNSQLRVRQVATGVHVNGGCTVFWGLVYAASQSLTTDDVLTALKDAGFDASRSGPVQPLEVPAVTAGPALAADIASPCLS